MDKRASRRRKKGERSRRRRRKRKKTQTGFHRPSFVVDKLGDNIPSWIERVTSATSPEERSDAIEDLREDIADKTKEIISLVSGFDPLGIIANLVVQNFLIDPESFKEHLHDGDAFMVEHIALLLLREPYSPGSNELFRFNSTRVTELCHEIKALTLFLRDFERGPVDIDDEAQLAYRALQFRALSNDFSLRSSGYEHHTRDDVEKLFRPFSDRLRSLLGFEVDDILAVDKVLCDRQGRIVTEKMKQIGEYVLKLNEAVEAGDDCSGNFDRGFLDELRKCPREKRVKQLFQLGSAYISQELGGDSGLVFRIQEIANAANLEPEKVGMILDFFCLEFGSQPEEYLEFESSHPLKERPIVKAGDRFLYTCPGAMLWAIKDRLERAINPDVSSSGDRRFWEDYQKHRGDYLEEAALALLKRAFPFAEIHQGMDYEFTENGQAKRYELDGLILCDRTVIFVEMKAVGWRQLHLPRSVNYTYRSWSPS